MASNKRVHSPGLDNYDQNTPLIRSDQIRFLVKPFRLVNQITPILVYYATGFRRRLCVYKRATFTQTIFTIRGSEDGIELKKMVIVSLWKSDGNFDEVPVYWE